MIRPVVPERDLTGEYFQRGRSYRYCK